MAWHIEKGMAKQIISIGLPAGIQWVGNSLASIFVQTYANLFGSDFIAANSIVTKLEQFATIPNMAVRGLAVLAFMCLFEGIDRGLVNALRGAGKSVVPMCTALAGTFTRIPFTYLLAVRPMNFMGFFYAMLLATAVRSLAIGAYYFCGGWKRAEQQIREKAARGEAVRRQR